MSLGAPPSESRATTRGRHSRVLVWVLCFALVGLVIWNGADRVPADPSRPLLTSLGPEPRSKIESDTLRVVSFNIHGGKGDGDVIDLARTAEVIGPCDLAGLYEVRQPGTGDNQAAILGSHLGLSSWFAATERHWWREHFGNGLLSRVTPAAIQRIPLPGTRGKAFRNAILAHLPWRDRTLKVLAVHLDREADRQRQLDLIVPLFLAMEGPAILMGDLNTLADEPRLQTLSSASQVISVREHLTAAPPDMIDWLFAKGLTIDAAELVENDVSDHPVLRVTLRLP